MSTTRTRIKAIGIIGVIYAGFLIFSVFYTAYFVLFVRDCVHRSDCDFTKFGKIDDPLTIAIIGIALATGVPLIQYLFKKINNRVEDSERCAELKKQLTALKHDYEQMKYVKNAHIFIIMNQKNSRLVIISNLADSLRLHYSKELSQDISNICEKGIRFPCSANDSSLTKFERECDMLILLIEDVLLLLDKKPHVVHR
ncbi:MAG: hypothetical protein WAO91_08860 [Candidatus Nitrosotenuis sp.]